MAELPQLNDDNVMENVQPSSRADGFNALAKVFGTTADTYMDKAEQVAAEKSNAMLMQSANLSEDLKTNSQIQMIQNPGAAAQIAQNAETTYNSIKQTAYVNDEDRVKLNYMINRDLDETRLKAATVDHEQALRGAGIKFWDNYPVTMQQITQALDTHDMKTAKILEENLHSNALAAAQSQAISPEQYATVRKASLDLYDNSVGMMQAAQNPNGMTAAEYHARTASPFDSNSFDNIGQPVDGNTQWMSNHLNSDRTVQGQFQALYNGQSINYGVVAGSKPEEVERFKQAIFGVNQVKGEIAAGVPFNQIAARIDSISAKGKGLLNANEEAQVNYWKSLNNRLQTDNAFYGIMGQTVLGQQYTAEHQAQSQALMATKTGADLQIALRDNDNKYIGQMLDAARASHLPPQYTQPIPSDWINEGKAAFQANAPVLPLIQRLNYINPEYRAYLANEMPKGNQAMAVYVSGLTLGKTDLSFQQDLIKANQDTQSPITQAGKGDTKANASLVLSGKSSVATKPDNVWQDVLNSNPNMKALYTYLGQLPGGNSQTSGSNSPQDGFRNMAVNYIYHQAAKAGDATLANKSDYVNDFVGNVTKGFNLYRTNQAVINFNDIPLTRTQDADYLSNYALSEAYRNLHKGKSENEFLTSMRLNPLMVVSTPDRRLVVIDRYGRAAVDNDGHEAFDMPYTSHMLAAAHKRTVELSSALFKNMVPQDATQANPSLNTYDLMRRNEDNQ